MKRSFDLEGMHCASCAYRLQKYLRKRNGIREAYVNLASETLLIDFDPDKLSLKELARDISRMGYKLILTDDRKDERFNYELKIRRKSLKRRRRRHQLITAIIFLIPLLLTGLSPLLNYPLPTPIDYIASPVSFTVMQALLCIPIILAGWRFFEKGWRRLVTLSPNIDSLVAIGATASLIYSVVSTIKILFYGGTLENNALYYLTAGAIIAMMMLGRFLENGLRTSYQNSLYRLINLIPLTSTRIIHGDEIQCATNELEEKDQIRISPGSRIPVDGYVISGHSMVDESVFTGSHVPLLKSKGDKVIAGMLNQEGYLTIEATKTGKNTFLSTIIRLIEEGESSEPPIGRLADKVSAWAIPFILAFSLLSAVAWFIYNQDWAFAMNIFISVLMIGSPVAIGLAIPLSVVFVNRRAASFGIMIRRSEAIEQIRKAHVMVFNLTGTITEGIAEVTDIIPKNQLSADALLELAASAESQSLHPLARAIVAEAKSKSLPISTPDPIRLIAGEGIEAVIHDQRIDIGNYKLMELINIDPEALSGAAEVCRHLADQGKTAVMIAVEGQLEGIIAVMDRARPEAREVVQELEKQNIEVALLTGEHASTARKIGSQVDISHIFADILPANRARQIRKLQHDKQVVIMVGDGMNDASALAQADAGIAIGSPDNIAADAADIVLLNKDLRLLLTVMRLSRKTMRNIKENIFFAFFYNLLMLPVAAGILYLFGWKFLLDPMIAVGVMFLGSLSVLINALRLRKFK